MRSPDEKGKFSTNISENVIEEALKSVEKRAAEVAGKAPAGASNAAAPELDEEPPTSPTLPGPPPAVVAAPVGVPFDTASEATTQTPALKDADPRDAEIEQLRNMLLMSTDRGREMKTRLDNEHEKMLRAAADLENFKKRAAKEKEEVQKYGSEKLLKDVLPVADNLDRALEHARSATDFDSLKKGVEMIRKLFEDILAKHGVKSFSAKGKAFDPNLHEAMTAAESADLPPNHVHSEVLRGYTLNDRLVRPALVVVSKAPSAPAPVPAPAAEAASAPTTATTDQPAADPSPAPSAAGEPPAS